MLWGGLGRPARFGAEGSSIRASLGENRLIFQFVWVTQNMILKMREVLLE